MLSVDFYSQDKEEVEEPFLRISHKNIKKLVIKKFSNIIILNGTVQKITSWILLKHLTQTFMVFKFHWHSHKLQQPKAHNTRTWTLLWLCCVSLTHLFPDCVAEVGSFVSLHVTNQRSNSRNLTNIILIRIPPSPLPRL